ncbi:MAG: protease modulator HflC [Thermoanaerobaculia bacterium]
MSRALIAALALIAASLLWTAAYTVPETEQVIITQFGKPVGDPITEPGLHFKIPLIQQIHRFDKRFLEWDGDPNQLPTRDKRFIWINTFARWRISDPLVFFQRLRDEAGAQSRLDDILDGKTRDAIANHDLVELVRSSNREPLASEESPEDEVEFQEIRFGRDKIRREVLQAARESATDLGLEILDVQLKRLDYVEQVRQQVYDRMVAERLRIAERYRSEGQGEASRILGQMDRELKRVQSEAFREAEEIRGDADAEATRIYAEAYDRSPAARQFYAFLKSLETLPASVDERTTVVLSTDGELYRYLEDTNP